jgi:hypothetical protein
MQVMHGGGAGGPRVCELGHKRGQWGHMYGDVGLWCMSCDARMHGVANDTTESGVMRMGEEPDCLTVFSHCFAGNACTNTVKVPLNI